MGSERDYPYDSKAKCEELNGLDKLRAVPDREMAATLYRLFFALMPDTPTSEVYDPGTYGDEEPDLGGELHDAVGARAEERDRACASVHYAWKEFYSQLDDYEREHGRRLTLRQRQDHEYRFGGLLEKMYGITHATSVWESRRQQWDERVTGGRSQGAQS